MSRPLLASVLVVALVGAPTLARADYDDHDAVRDCEREGSSDGYRDFEQLRAERQGKKEYRVTGRTRKSGGGHWTGFTCYVHHGEVTSWRAEKSHDGDGKATAAAVGAGLLGVALIAAVASASDSKNAKDSTKAPANRDWRNEGAFDDRMALEKDCKRELDQHLDYAHGPVRDIRFLRSNLADRELSGSAEATWESGDTADITFECQFDRTGRIVDGRYHYTGR